MHARVGRGMPVLLPLSSILENQLPKTRWCSPSQPKGLRRQHRKTVCVPSQVWSGREKAQALEHECLANAFHSFLVSHYMGCVCVCV